MTLPSTPIASAAVREPDPKLVPFILRGSFGFGLVGVLGFAVWAFAGKLFRANLGEVGLYLACLVVFLGSSGLLLHNLVMGPRSFPRFYRIFIPAFLAYAILWCAAWFLLHFGAGEWLGSLLGSVGFVAVAGWGFGNYRGFWKATVALFVFHSAGYFLGGKLMHSLLESPPPALSQAQVLVLAKLGWGVLYGLGFGAGLGFVFHTFQSQVVSDGKDAA